MGSRKVKSPFYLVLFLVTGLSISSINCSYIEGLTVEDYLKKVEEIQLHADSALLDLNSDLGELTGDLNKVSEAVSRLQNQREAVTGARSAIADLKAPEEALTLKDDLLKLYDSGGGIIDELVAFGNYRLEAEPLFGEYDAAAGKFNNEIQNGGDEGKTLTAFKNYEQAIAALAAKATQLQPPAMAANSHRRFVGNLETLNRGLGEMTLGIEGGDENRVEAASEKLASVSGDNDEFKKNRQSDRVADISAYNGKIAEMKTLVEKINLDQATLREEFDRV